MHGSKKEMETGKDLKKVLVVISRHDSKPDLEKRSEEALKEYIRKPFGAEKNRQLNCLDIEMLQQSLGKGIVMHKGSISVAIPLSWRITPELYTPLNRRLKEIEKEQNAKSFETRLPSLTFSLYSTQDLPFFGMKINCVMVSSSDRVKGNGTNGSQILAYSLVRLSSELAISLIEKDDFPIDIIRGSNPKKMARLAEGISESYDYAKIYSNEREKIRKAISIEEDKANKKYILHFSVLFDSGTDTKNAKKVINKIVNEIHCADTNVSLLPHENVEHVPIGLTYLTTIPKENYEAMQKAAAERFLEMALHTVVRLELSGITLMYLKEDSHSQF